MHPKLHFLLNQNCYLLHLTKQDKLNMSSWLIWKVTASGLLVNTFLILNHFDCLKKNYSKYSFQYIIYELLKIKQIIYVSSRVFSNYSWACSCLTYQTLQMRHELSTSPSVQKEFTKEEKISNIRSFDKFNSTPHCTSWLQLLV